MKKLCVFLSIIIMISMIIFLTKCKKDDNPSQIQNIVGYVQKGPFINGSSITVYDLLSDLSPSGKSYNSQITDNKGSFQLNNIPLSSNYVSIRADGFYFNEILGKQSVSQITLYALSDISGESEINVNILTDLEKPRVEYLMENGKSFADSKKQAQKEILAIFNIEKSDIITSENLNISESGDDNGILLAISLILQGFRSEGEMTELLSNLRNDIKEDGILSSSALGSELINHAIILDTSSIKSNLTNRYSDIGATASIPEFGYYITNFISKTQFVVNKYLISYPNNGRNGDNILSLSNTAYTSGLDVPHSLAAQLARNTALKIKMTSLTTITTQDTGGVHIYKPIWCYELGSPINWSITVFNYTDYSQEFTAIEGDKSCDLRMFFEKGSFLIEYFEMNSILPTRKKTIICQ